jgi:multidrug efflux pump
MAAGFQEQGDDRFYIKIPSLVEDYQDLLNMPVKIYQNRAITLGDIATIRNTYRDREVYPRLNGQDSIAINVSKRSGFSIIDTVAYLKQFMVVAQKHLPPGITVTFSQDKSSYIKTMLSDLQNNIASAIILVLIIIVAVLGVRSGLLVGISIPSSFMLALIALYASGVSVNVVVLFSLILSAGLIVDSVIVVTEFANRMMQRGFSKVEAYLTSVKRMAAPIIASTMTTLAAFLPLLFWPDVTGQFMQYMPITLLMTLTASLIMGLVFLPIIGCYIGGIGNDAPKAGAYHDYADVKNLKGFIGHYVALLTYVVTRPKRIVFSAVAFMVTILTLYGFLNHGVKFFPAIEPDLATVKVLARGNLSLDAKDAIIRPIEEKLIASGYYDSVYTRSGYRDTRNDAQDVIGSMQIAFKDWDQRPPVAEIIDQILAINQDLVGAYLEVSVQRAGPQQGKPVNLIIKADAVSSLEDAARDVLLRMAKLGVFTNIDSTMAYQNIEWEYDIDKVEAAKYGITLNNIGQLMRLAGSGLVIDDYSPDDYDDNVDVTARFSQEYRNIDILKNLKVATNRGMQPISLFVTRKPVLRSSEINRVDRDRVVRIKSDVQQGVLATNAIDMLMQDIALKPLAQGASIILKGDQEKQNKAADFLVKAFIVAVFLILMILLIQFNSFYAVLLILSAVILSTGGVLIGLLLTQQPFIIVMGGVGVISLAGIVVNNNIVLIDTFKTHLKRDDVSVFEAIIITGVQRLRPILLTTVTTILGLLPMVLQLNINFVAREVSLGAPSTQWWVQLATCISFGLAIATIVTLVLTPALIAWRYCKR